MVIFASLEKLKIMLKIERLLLVIVMFLSVAVTAQQLEDRILLTIDGNEYDAGIFMRTYLKNLDIVQDESQKNLDNYLELYKDYRLKLLQAYELGLENGDAYKKELNNYRNTLAQGYLTDSQVSDRLINEAYERMKTEVNASHILVQIGRGDAPVDTLKAWNKIQQIRKEVMEGADFATTARAKSEGPSAKTNGELGWFSVFRMVYPFENAAFNTPVGKVSDVFRSDFGYHILKVNDTRPNPGELTVAHIMTVDSKEAKEQTAESRIKEVYSQLQETGKFEELAREFSDDIQTAPKGGRLRKFGSGGLNAPIFEERAFALDKIGEYTEPFKSKFGWHIVKLIEKHPITSFKENKKSIADRIKRTPRARKITEAFTSNLRKKYEVTQNNEALAHFKNSITDSILTNNWNAIEGTKASEILFSIKEQSYTYGDFYDHLEKQQLKDFKDYKDKDTKILKMYNGFIDAKISDYYKEHLEEENKDFAFVYNEYKEGLLLFDLMEKNIWEKAKNDSIGQQQYYEAHKDKYQWKRRLDITMTQNTTEEVALEVQQLLRDGADVAVIKERFNIDNRTKVLTSKGIVEETYNRLPDNFKLIEGVSDIYYDATSGFYKVIVVHETLEPSQKTLDEARGSVINDYQQQLEKQWLDSLRIGRDIKVNKKTFKKVKKHIAAQRS